MISRIDEMGHAEALAPLLLPIIQIDTDNHVRADHPQTLNNIQTDTAEAEDHGVATRLRLCRVDHRADAGGHAAADVTDLVERRVWIDLCQRNLRQHGEIGKGRGTHIMQDRLALDRKTACAVRHHTLALGGADRLAQIGLRVETIFAFTTFRRVERNDMVTRRNTGHTRANLADNPCALMTENGREHAFRISAGQGEGVCMANASGHDLDKNLAMARAIKINFHDFKRLAGSHRDSGTRLHLHFLLWRHSCDGVPVLQSR